MIQELKSAESPDANATIPPSGSTAVQMERDLYGLALRAGIKLTSKGRLKRGMRYLVEPIPYWRSLEYRTVWRHGAFNARDKILDIGSPKLFSLYLAWKTGAIVHATDIENYFIDEYQTLAGAFGMRDQNYRTEVQDGRALDYPDGSFSKVVSISVLEHIPELGDSACAAEIGRVLEPGGTCLLTVPFWPESKNIYRRAADFYWAGSSAQREDGLVFFQRRYSEIDLHKRLIEPSGLSVEQLLYVGERFLVKSHREVSELLPRVGLGPVHPLLSRLAHTPATSNWRGLSKPLCAFLKLRKVS